MEEFTLHADIQPIQLESGLTLIAPGLVGEGVWHSQLEVDQSRAFTNQKGNWDEAVAEAGLEDRHTLAIKATLQGVEGGEARSSGDVPNDELLLQVPLGNQEKAFVVYKDQMGIMSFHYSESVRGPDLPSQGAFAARQEQFRIKLRPGQPVASGADRGLFGDVTSKIIKVVILKAFPNQTGKFAARRVKAWEDKYRQFQGFHGGGWQELLNNCPQRFSDFEAIKGKPSLLFLHGTTSSTFGAFGSLVSFPTLLERLYSAYGGRVVGFNHHTLNTGVAQNVRDFYDALSEAPGEYVFDIICHSRGGVVARALTLLPDALFASYFGSPWQRPANVKIKIRRIVFVATPNAGTHLAIPAKIPGFVERLINVVNMLPDSAATIATGALLSIAASVAEVTLPLLQGLADQAPNSDLLHALNSIQAPEYFAFQASFEPSESVFNALKNVTADKLFDELKNDLVVPTEGVSNCAAFKLSSEQVIAFGRGDGVYHTNFFSQKRIEKIADFLAV